MFDYPYADANAQPEIQAAISRFRRLPLAEKADQPLLYWLIGTSTPAFKMSKPDSHYGRPPIYATGQRCANCSSAYQHVVSTGYICSSIAGSIQPQAWCRLWNTRDGGYQ